MIVDTEDNLDMTVADLIASLEIAQGEHLDRSGDAYERCARWNAGDFDCLCEHCRAGERHDEAADYFNTLRHHVTEAVEALAAAEEDTPT